MDNSDLSRFSYSFVGRNSDWSLTAHKTGLLQGNQVVTNKIGAFVNFTFAGEAFTIYGDKYNDHGMFQVNVDEQPLARGSGFAPETFASMQNNPKPSEVLYASPKLPFGTHLVQYINLGRQSTSAVDDFVSMDFVEIQITSGTVESSQASLVSAVSFVARTKGVKGAAPSKQSASSGESSGLSPGAIAGIAVGAAALLTAIGLATFFLLRKRKTRREYRQSYQTGAAVHEDTDDSDFARVQPYDQHHTFQSTGGRPAMSLPSGARSAVSTGSPFEDPSMQEIPRTRLDSQMSSSISHTPLSAPTHQLAEEDLCEHLPPPAYIIRSNSSPAQRQPMASTSRVASAPIESPLSSAESMTGPMQTQPKGYL